jgi:hypothetical protein
MDYMASLISDYYEAMDQQRDQVWDEGAAAFSTGASQFDNPYDPASWQNREWGEAYRAEKNRGTNDAS